MADAARSLATLLVPIFPGEPIRFGPVPAQDVAISLLAMTGLCSAAGYYLTHRSPALLLRLFARLLPYQLRHEAWEEAKLGAEALREDPATAGAAEEGEAVRQRPQLRKRTGAELLFIAVHNGAVTLLAMLAWLLGLPSLALHAFCLEIGYEIFDSISLGLKRMEPETLIHHIVSPICIICSTQTDVDFRVLCHLCVCIDVSGALLGYSKFLLRYSHLSPCLIYRRLFWAYTALRVVFPLIDSIIIVTREVTSRGGFLQMSGILETKMPAQYSAAFGRTDWTQLYFWAMAVLNAFNIYFCLVIRARSRMPPQLVASQEMRTGCR